MRPCVAGVDSSTQSTKVVVCDAETGEILRSGRAPHGVVCFTGMLSNEWTVRDFYPIDYIPHAHA